MKYPHSIPLWRTNGELFPGGVPSRVVLSSVGTKWNDVVLEQHHLPSLEVTDVMYKRHVIAINIGHSVTNEFKKAGRFQHVFKARGAFNFFPSDQPFFLRLKVERIVFANVLFLALDYPLFNTLKPVVKGFAAPSVVVDMYHRRKLIEQNILSSHGDATRFFVTFLDNHDMKERIRFEQPGDEHRFDDQLTLGLATLYCMPGIPCLYYGTEQGLHGSGSDPAVREALWGITPLFPEKTFFYQEIQKITTVRDAEPALRYGRFYFRPVSGDGQTFGVSSFPGGVLAVSRILNDQEVIVVANTSTSQGQSVDVILEMLLSQENTNYRVLYGNQKGPVVPSPVRKTGTVTVHEVDGTIGNGPLHVIRVTLRPLEIQILRH
jgi:Alpha amylase, catalytic domain